MERVERVDARRDGLSTAQLRGGRQGQILRGVCVCALSVHAVYLCICMPVVLMYLLSKAFP